MTKLPTLSGPRLITALRKAGFEVIRVKGSHHLLRHSDGRCTVISRCTGVRPSGPASCPRSCAIATWLAKIWSICC